MVNWEAVNFNLDELNLNPWHGDTITWMSNIKDVCNNVLIYV